MANYMDLKDAAAVGQLALDSSECSRRQLAAIIQTAMDAIITTDEKQRIVIFNKAAETMFGCPVAEAVGQPLGRFIPQRFREDHAEQVRFFGATGGTSRRMGKMGIVWGSRVDGKEFPLEISISQVESDGRRLFTAVLRDVSERMGQP